MVQHSEGCCQGKDQMASCDSESYGEDKRGKTQRAKINIMKATNEEGEKSKGKELAEWFEKIHGNNC